MDVAVIEASFGQIAPRANEVVALFYETLLEKNPRMRPMFNTPIDEQKRHLIAALVTIVQTLRRPDELSAYLSALGGRHVTYGVVDTDYPIVGRTLIDAMQKTLGNAWDPAWTPQWEDAYGAVTSLMRPAAVTPN